MNKLNCEEGGGEGCFKRGKVRVACLDGDKAGRKWRSIMAWSKLHHCQCVQEMERAREGMVILLDDVWCSAGDILWMC